MAGIEHKQVNRVSGIAVGRKALVNEVRVPDADLVEMAKAVHDQVAEKVEKTVKALVKDVEQEVLARVTRLVEREIERQSKALGARADERIDDLRKGHDAGLTKILNLVRALPTPTVNNVVNVPQGKAPEVKVENVVNSPDVTVNVPAQEAPRIDVHLPEQKAPDVKIENVVNVPEQKAGDVIINVPEQHPPLIEVNVSTPPRRKEFFYDEHGRPMVIEEEDRVVEKEKP